LIKKAIVLLTAALTLLSVFMVSPLKALAYDELKNTDPDKYYILLDLKNQIVTVFERDENGEYTKIVRRFICTTGRTELNPEDPEDKGTPTPQGIWKIGARERFGEFAAFDGTYARYWTQIVEGVYFHSVMYSRHDVNTLQSGPYRRLGNKGSHGCVRLDVEDAKWLYYYACPGTTVNVSNGEPFDKTVKSKLKAKRMPFNNYKAFQVNIYDIDELPNPKAWVVKDGAEIRTGNGSNDSVRKRVPAGTELELLQIAETWCKVKFEKREGYMRTAYLTFKQGTMMSREDADIIKTTAYMYSEKSTDAKYRITKVPNYTSVKVLEPDNDGWTKIRYWGEEGYVQSRYLTKGWGVIPEVMTEIMPIASYKEAYSHY